MSPHDTILNRRQVLTAFAWGAGGAVLLGAASACGGSGGGGAGSPYRGEVAVTHMETNISAVPFLVAAELGTTGTRGWSWTWSASRRNRHRPRG